VGSIAGRGGALLLGGASLAMSQYCGKGQAAHNPAEIGIYYRILIRNRILIRKKSDLSEWNDRFEKKKKGI